MTQISKLVGRIFDIVKEIPLIHIEAFSIRSCLNLEGMENLNL